MSEADPSAAQRQLRARREAVVREHMESENVHDFDTTIGTFEHPRYELIATGETYDGEAEVRGYFAETRTAFPDQRNELIALHHAEDAVVAEFYLLGTHLGPLRALPPTGRAFRCRMTAFFIFEDDRLVCERVYFDQATILRQLGLARDPSSLPGRVGMLLSHPLTIGRALLGSRPGHGSGKSRGDSTRGRR
jgi:steroid delta-isomerase-like uncharacterized protein